MDDDTAEIELLEQNLLKTRQISQRMISILSNFDGRLGKLEKSIMPLYTSTQLLTRRARNIESALQKLDEVASNQEGIAAEEALILRGPQQENLQVYKETVERLNASIAFQSVESVMQDTARLVETGARKLVQLYTRLVAEGSAEGAGHVADLGQAVPFPEEYMHDLGPLVTFLRTLPIPATHPSHPAANAILGALKDALHGYADMRAMWAFGPLEAPSKALLDRAAALKTNAAGREFTRWLDGILAVEEYEYELLLMLSPLQAPPYLMSAYSTLLQPIVDVFNKTLLALVATIKRSLATNNFLALSAYASVAERQPRWDAIHLEHAGWREGERREGVAALRSLVLRSFPEFLADIKLAGTKVGDVSPGIMAMTAQTIRYLGTIPNVSESVGSVLLQLGDGNWKMGEGAQVARGPKLGTGDESVIIEHYCHDVVMTTLGSLSALARGAPDPAVGSIMWLNNVAHLRQKFFDDPDSMIGPLLARPTADAVESGFRMAKATYFAANFSPLMQALADERERKVSIKDKYARFFDMFDELAERHRAARVMGQDEDGRETLVEEVVKLVVPSLQGFMSKTKEKDKSSQKYIKMSAEEVEAQIRGFYK